MLKNLPKYSQLFILLLLLHSCHNKNEYASIKVEFAASNIQSLDFSTYDLLTLGTESYPETSWDTADNTLIVPTENPLFGILSINEESNPVYLEKDFHLSINGATENERAFLFKGNGAGINNYLLEYQTIEDKSFKLEPYTYLLQAEAFKARIDSLQNALNRINTTSLSAHERSLIDKIRDAKSTNYELQYLIGSHQQGNPIPDQLLPSWSQLERNDDLFDLKYPDYGIALHFFLDVFFYNELRKPPFITEDSLVQQFYAKADGSIRVAKIDGRSKELLVARNLSWAFLMTGLNSSTKSMYERFKEDFPNSKCLKSLENTRAEFYKLQEGEIAPNIVCLAPDDRQLSFSDLKGKVLYVDIWATWCAPCIKEFPFSQSLIAKYNKDEVSFVYLSIDEDKDKWQSFLNQNQDLVGIHIVENEKGAVLKNFQLSDIPRYIIIDSEGRIVDSDAPSPSSGKVEGILDKLLQQN